MAVNKPAGDNARKGAVKKRSQLKTTLGGRDCVDQAQQKGRWIHGRQKARQEEKGSEEIQRRQAGEVMGKIAIALLAVGIAVLIGFSVWVIVLWLRLWAFSSCQNSASLPSGLSAFSHSVRVSDLLFGCLETHCIVFSDLNTSTTSLWSLSNP
jgi:hypothetical protein